MPYVKGNEVFNRSVRQEPSQLKFPHHNLVKKMHAGILISYSSALEHMNIYQHEMGA